MAEFVLRDMVTKMGVQDEFYIASSATSTEEIFCGRGNPVYPPARDELKKHGISCEGKRAVQLRASDYDCYDLFIGMDSANIRNMMRILGGDKDSKIRKLLDYAYGGDVADPWYSGDFEATYRDVKAGCEKLLKSLGY